jgi:hypothetical protein
MAEGLARRSARMPQERDPVAITEVLATAYRIEDLILDVRRERVTRDHQEIDLANTVIRCPRDLSSLCAGSRVG